MNTMTQGTAGSGQGVIAGRAVSNARDKQRDVSLTEIGLSARVLQCLRDANMTTVRDIAELWSEGDDELLKLNGIGPKSVAEIKRQIKV
jgi:DNA-directed RNA polymerase alpha subunit